MSTTSPPVKHRQKTNLIQFQQRLNERLNASAVGPSLSARLAFEVGAEFWLLPLSAISEVLPVPTLEPVPLARPWFAGVANVRGNLYGVTDLQHFLRGVATPIDGNARILLINRSRLAGSALLVSRTVGLRRDDQLQANDRPTAGKFVRRSYREESGQDWLELDIGQFLTNPDFLQITHTG